MILFCRRFVFRGIAVDTERCPEAAVFAGERSFAKVGQRKELEPAVVPIDIEVNHRLAKLGFLVDVFHEVGLVNDVDEMSRLGDTPEDLVDTDGEIPIVTVDAPVQFPEVRV